MNERIKQLAAAAVAAAQSVTKPKYFSNSRKGENFELKAELNSDSKYKKKEAVKKVIANMTVGKDVSSLFADVLKCMQTDDLELKKLVYLYLMNYAKSQPELVILAVNTFCKDTEDPNPLIRALAIRTMGCIRVDKMVDYLCEPLKKALHDDNPYVRKTAVICVAKLYDLNPNLAEEHELMATLQHMLSDSNPMVVSNVVAALAEIHESSPHLKALVITPGILSKLLAALNECTEWGQTFILDALSDYVPRNTEEVESIIERVLPRLQHANGSVVLSAVKVLLLYLDSISNVELSKQVVKKLSPPLVSLLSSFPEAQYVALRNINLVLQKNVEILSSEIRIFFCKYNDPIYVKLEKLEIIMKLVSDENIDQVLSELKEYANEGDVEFVRKSIKVIGRCAIKVDQAVDRCVTVLLELIKTKVDYIVEESIVVIKDIFRKFPNRYEGILSILCENLDSLNEAESKASMIWIIGEYADKISNALVLLEYFVELFTEESIIVQLQLVTAAVKLYLKKPNEGQDLVQKLLQLATKCENADLRDRAYMYWRMLSADPHKTIEIVLSEKPGIVDESGSIDKDLLNLLIKNISTLSSVFHKPPHLFVAAAVAPYVYVLPSTAQIPAAGEDVSKGLAVEDLLDLNFDGAASPAISTPQNSRSPVPAVIDLLSDDLFDAPTTINSFSPSQTSPVHNPNVSYQLYLPASEGQGLEIRGSCDLNAGKIVLSLQFTNKSSTQLSDFAIQFNKNSFALCPSILSVKSPLNPGTSSFTTLTLDVNPAMFQIMDPVSLLQVAVKTNVDIFYFQIYLPFSSLIDTATQINFSQIWNGNFQSENRTFASDQTLDDISKRFTAKGIKFSTNHSLSVQFSHKLINGVTFAGEIQSNFGDISMAIKADDSAFIDYLLDEFQGIVEGKH